MSLSVTINQAAAQADPTNGNILYDVVFSQPVTGFVANDIVFTGSTVGGALVASIAPGIDAAHYTVTVTGMDGSGTVVASIPAGVVSNGLLSNDASTSTDNVVTFDNIPPDTQITSEPPAQSSSTNATFTFSATEPGGATEPGASFQYSLDSGALVVSTSSTITLTNLSEGSHTIEVAAKDALGNVDQTPASYTWTIAPVISEVLAQIQQLPTSISNDNIDVILQAVTAKLNEQKGIIPPSHITGVAIAVDKAQALAAKKLALSDALKDPSGNIIDTRFTNVTSFGDVKNQLTFDGKEYVGTSYVEKGFTFSATSDVFGHPWNVAFFPGQNGSNYDISTAPGGYGITMEYNGGPFGVRSININEQNLLPGFINRETIEFVGIDENGVKHVKDFTTDGNPSVWQTVVLPVEFQSNLKSLSWSAVDTGGLSLPLPPLADDIVVIFPQVWEFKTSVTPGPHSFAVQVTDQTGTVSPLFSLGTAPTSTISEALKNDTGISSTDLITTDGRVTVSGTASEPVTSVEIWNAATKTLIGTATIDTTNHESWSFTGTLGEGTYQLYAKLTDLATNIGQTTPLPTIDVVAPPSVVAVRTGVTAGASVTVNAVNGVLANDTDPSGDTLPSGHALQVSAVDGLTVNNTITIAGNYGSLTLNSDGSYTYTASSSAVLPANGIGQDVFTYTAESVGGTADSTLTVLVTATGLTYLGGIPNTTITGPNGHSPVLDGGAGGDILVATNGATVLIGGPGDKLTGGNGTDTYVFTGQFGQNTITNYNPAKDIIDLDKTEFANLGAVQNAAKPDVTNASNTVITDGSGDTIKLIGVNLSQLHFDASHFVLV